MDGGFTQGRQFGRGFSGGQVRDDRRSKDEYDPGRGGFGKADSESQPNRNLFRQPYNARKRSRGDYLPSEKNKRASVSPDRLILVRTKWTEKSSTWRLCQFRRKRIRDFVIVRNWMLNHMKTWRRRMSLWLLMMKLARSSLSLKSLWRSNSSEDKQLIDITILQFPYLLQKYTCDDTAIFRAIVGSYHQTRAIPLPFLETLPFWGRKYVPSLQFRLRTRLNYHAQ